MCFFLMNNEAYTENTPHIIEHSLASFLRRKVQADKFLLMENTRDIT